MEYLAYRGVFADIPFDEIRDAFRHYYPRMTREQEEMPLGGWVVISAQKVRRKQPRSEGSRRGRPPTSPCWWRWASFGPLTMSIYTPVMPSVGVDLATGADSVKFTLTTYMLGFAVGQLFYGPLSDRFGRRPVLLVRRRLLHPHLASAAPSRRRSAA